MRWRLLSFRQLAPAQLRLELTYLAQIIVFFASGGLLAANLLGQPNLAWLLILLLYPFNRPFLRYMVQQAPEHVPAGLVYCLLRPVGWLAGLLVPPK